MLARGVGQRRRDAAPELDSSPASPSEARISGDGMAPTPVLIHASSSSSSCVAKLPGDAARGLTAARPEQVLRFLRTTRDGEREGEKEGCEGVYLRLRKRNSQKLA